MSIVPRKFLARGLSSLLFLSGIFLTSSRLGADEWDDLFESEFNLTGELEEQDSSSPSRFCDFSTDGISTDQVLDFLRSVDLLQAPLWQNTYFQRTRDSLYFLPHERMMAASRSGVSVRYFFNKSNEILFPFVDLCSLALDRERIELILSLIGDTIAEGCGLPIGTSIDADSLLNILPRLNNLSIEGRKSGLGLQLSHKINRFTLGFESALLLNERNAFASERIKEEVLALFMDAIGGVPLPPSDFDEVREFARIKIGLGDTRLSAGINLIERSNFYLNIGTSVIMPTGNRGVLRDGRFMKPSELESNNRFDFIVNPPRELLLVPRLGHNGHFALGCAAESRLQIADGAWDIRARLAYDHFFGGTESRLAMFKKRLPPQEATTQQFREQYLIPTEIELRVYPGDIFTGLLGIDYHVGDFTFTAGYDYYLHQREEFGTLVDNCFNAADLKLEHAVQGQFDEHHVTLAMHYTKPDGLLFGIGGDWTFKARGSANSWTAFVSLYIPF